MMKMSRKEFLRSLVGIGVGVAGVSALTACGGGGGDDEPPVDGPGGNPNCQTNGVAAAIGSNHGHTLNIPTADIQSTTDKQYMMTLGGHNHPLTVTAAMFAMLRQNMSVSGRSQANDGTGHDHTFTINCVG